MFLLLGDWFLEPLGASMSNNTNLPPVNSDSELSSRCSCQALCSAAHIWNHDWFFLKEKKKLNYFFRHGLWSELMGGEIIAVVLFPLNCPSTIFTGCMLSAHEGLKGVFDLWPCETWLTVFPPQSSTCAASVCGSLFTFILQRRCDKRRVNKCSLWAHHVRFLRKVYIIYANEGKNISERYDTGVFEQVYCCVY